MNDKFSPGTKSALQDLLSTLSIDDCKELQQWLKKRIKYLENIPHIKRKLEDLNLSIRAYNALMGEKLVTVEDVLRFGIHRIHLIRNIGQKTAKEIILAVEGKTQ